VDGPFAEAKEVIGGYWMIQVKSKEEAIEWARRRPASENEVIEIRQVQEYTRTHRGWVKAVEGKQHAGFLEGLVVFHHCRHVFRVGHGARFGLLISSRNHQHHKSHRYILL
jgi:hypothetical protein